MRRFCCCAALLTAVCLLLCGCDFLAADLDNLLTPPKLTGDMYPIEEALRQSVKKEYTLIYPSGGDRRSAVILNDIDGDNRFEAFAFYSTAEDDAATMHVNMICQKDRKTWKSVAEQSIAAGGIDRVDFCDLDGDGREELLVGWSIYGSADKQLAVYSYNGQILIQRMLQSYSVFLCCDLDEDGENEIFVQYISTTDMTNRASLYRLDENGVNEVAGCLMDHNVHTAAELTEAPLTTGQPAIYAEEVKGTGAVTEVLMLVKGALVNPLLELETTENLRTLRYASLRCMDNDMDGILEIPVASELPAVDGEGNERSYYTNWCTFNGETLIEQSTVIMQQTDGYYLTVPGKWRGRIAVKRSSDYGATAVYEHKDNGTNGEMLAYFRIFSIDDWEKSDHGKLVELCRGRKQVFSGYTTGKGGERAVTEEELKKMLIPLE